MKFINILIAGVMTIIMVLIFTVLCDNAVNCILGAILFYNIKHDLDL